MSEHVIGVRTFFLVWIGLMIGTIVTVLVAQYNLGPFSAVVALTIATAKALLAVLFFMEVRYSSRMTIIAVISGVFWLGILLVLTLSDYISRPWLTYPTQ
jgi:cytochrome c oxidase subunit 4